MTKFTRTAAAAKTVTKPTRAKGRVEEPVIEVVGPEDDIHSAYAQIEEAARRLFDRIRKPSWMRELVNITLGLTVYASVFYGCMALVDMLVIGVIAYTGVGFISFMVSFFAILLTFMAAFKVGKAAYDFAAAFDFDNVKRRVASWLPFKRSVAA